MKNSLKLLVNEIVKREHFIGSEISLTINYEDIIPNFSPIELNNETFETLYNSINISNITSFNLTLKSERGTDWDNDGEPDYKWNWKSPSFIFYGKYESDKTDDDDEDVVLDKNMGMFEFSDLGARGMFDLRKELSRPDPNGKNEYSKIYGNYFEFDKVGVLLDKLIELDTILDKHHSEKHQLIENLRFEI
jgi:hypothetical protein